MSYALPLPGHPAREAMGDLATVAEILAPEHAAKLQPVWKHRAAALAFFEANPAARRYNVIVVRMDSDEKWLVSFGRKGGWRKLWNFGTGRPVAA